MSAEREAIGRSGRSTPYDPRLSAACWLVRPLEWPFPACDIRGIDAELVSVASTRDLSVE